MIKVLLVEDELMWQQGISALLEVETDMTLISIVDNADDAEVFFHAEKPNVILVDWKIKGPRDGLELAKKLSEYIRHDAIILVTGSPPDQIPEHAYRYVPKPRIAQDLVSQIRASYNDHTLTPKA